MSSELSAEDIIDAGSAFQFLMVSGKKLYLLMSILAVLGPVVQSIVSLTSSLRVISLTVLADSIYNILIFFAEKM